MKENSSINSTPHYTLNEVLNRPQVAVTSVFLICLILCTLVGNFLVIWTIFTTRRLRFSAFFFVASLAVADFLVGLFVLPISLTYHLTFEMKGRWILGSWTCKAWLLTNFWFCSASILNLCLVSWDRYVAVTSPLHYKVRMSDSKVKKMIVISWTLSFSCSIILITKAHLGSGSRTNCTIHGLKDPVFSVSVSLIVFVLPVFFLAFVNGKVWITARGHKKRISAIEDSMRFSFSNNWTCQLVRRNCIDKSSPRNSTSGRGGRTLTRTIKQEIKTFKTFLIVIGVFVVCWCPFYAYMIVDIFQPLNPFVFYLTILLGYCNSATNIFIYGIFNREFRKAIKQSIKCRELKLDF